MSAVLDPDPEVQAIQAMIARLSPLSPEARARVLSWAEGRFGPQSTPLYIREEPRAPALPRQVQRIDEFHPGFGER